MPTPRKQPSGSAQLTQVLVNFVIPIVILTKFSSASQLGPTRALLVALAFPVALELYSVYVKRTISMLSVLAIGGIVVTGAISLLGLSENWLAARRSIPYVAVAVVLLLGILVKRSPVTWVLRKMIDLDAVEAAATRRGEHAALTHLLRQVSYALAVLFLCIGVSSFLLTKQVISAPPNTAPFNAEYAKLRVMSIGYTTLPLLGGVVGTIMFLLSRLEKLTGLPMEELLKKKDR